MQAILTVDPRDNLEKAHRLELVRFANENGLGVTEHMPAILIRKLLRAKGLTKIAIAPRQIGVPTEPDAQVQVSQNVVNADDDLWRQWKEQAPDAEAPKPERKPNVIIELRRECKARGIKYARTDKADDLRAKLHG